MNEIEEVFFKTFGIEKKCNRGTLKFCVGDLDCNTCKSPSYPKITAEKLLEMICILNNLTGRLIELGSADINTLNEEILKICLFYYEVFKLPYKNEFTNKVKALFEE